MPRRKSIRLSPHLYREAGRLFSVTIATSPRSPVFANLDFGHECVALLRQTSTEGNLGILAYCLMPDHVHLLVRIDTHCDLTRLIGRWKSRCALARRRRGSPESFWQRSFYDHALRRDENVLVAARYILGNPIRAGLVSRVEDYPLSGSFEFDLPGRPQGPPRRGLG